MIRVALTGLLVMWLISLVRLATIRREPATVRLRMLRPRRAA